MKMSFSLLSVMAVFLIALLISRFMAARVGRSPSGLKVMLLGINITLLGLVFAFSSELWLSRLGYVIVAIGLIISVIGIRKND